MSGTDHTHAPGLMSWVQSANDHPDFPIQNLPLGIFAPPGGPKRAGIAIGDSILDLAAAAALGLIDGAAAAAVATATELNALFALGAPPRVALRHRVSALLAAGSPHRASVEPLLHAAADCSLFLPAAIGDYTDFYAGIHHARNVGALFRPDDPLLPNYKWVPIGYHGRASSVRPSGEAVRRPCGQRQSGDGPPTFGPTTRLDLELEVGLWIGPGNRPGEPIPIAAAGEHLVGLSLLNDWSARDIQSWEYRPLGPFLAKSFATTVSPWVVTVEALAPFRIAQPERPAGDPRPLPYLSDAQDQETGAFDVDLEVLILSERMRAAGNAPQRISTSNMRHLYWTAAQMIAHHASNGCDLRPGDLIGTGTISGPDRGSVGSLLEATRGGGEPIRLPGGEERRFLEDGDAIILRASCRRDGWRRIGFGDCRARITPAVGAE